MDPQATNEILHEQRNRFVSDGVASVTPMYVESAKGAIIKDVEGREFIDFAGGIAVMNIGHSHPKVVAAIKDQAEKFILPTVLRTLRHQLFPLSHTCLFAFQDGCFRFRLNQLQVGGCCTRISFAF